MRFRGLASLWVLLIISAPAMADEPSWQKSVTSFLQRHADPAYQNIDVSIRNADAAALYFNACSQPLLNFTHRPDKVLGRVVLKVSCEAAAQRPLFLQVDVSASASYWVTARAIAAEQKLTAADINMVTGDLRKLPQDVLLAEHVSLQSLTSNWSLRRSINAGAALTESLLNQTNVINYGDMITVHYAGQGFHVEQQAKALNQGAIGDIIRVQLQNRKTLNVKIVGENKAEVAK
ncbi:flagellar basal body P-ring formation chaperone FlgA [Pseudidiomarina homiensis]|uniref:flagellar basal body P-ring formation chaperone FlgA n=1 Tax=Pseudidiomarina homiensis TaxID=364198 RepID=UPI00215A7EC6|nr:flagellar basal body P-ring formation chaperone FlgA [Pseudidiomarina homiensis]